MNCKAFKLARTSFISSSITRMDTVFFECKKFKYPQKYPLLIWSRFRTYPNIGVHLKLNATYFNLSQLDNARVRLNSNKPEKVL